MDMRIITTCNQLQEFRKIIRGLQNIFSMISIIYLILEDYNQRNIFHLYK